MTASRQMRNALFWAGCTLAFICLTAPTISVLVSVFHQALPAFGWSLFLKRTNSVGLQNAILGTLLLLFGVLILAGTVGVLAGIYLAEFASGRTEKILRFMSEVLAGMPSIILGYVGYVALVVEFHWGYSLLAAVISLSVLVLPYIVKTTEVAFRQVPSYLREAAAGVGLPSSTTTWRVLLPPATPAVVSGVIIALAISTGELAPLLFTAGFTDHNPSLSLFHHQVPYLTSVIYTDISIPGARAHATAAAAGAVSLILLLLLIGLGRVVSRRARRSTERMTI